MYFQIPTYHAIRKGLGTSKSSSNKKSNNSESDNNNSKKDSTELNSVVTTGSTDFSQVLAPLQVRVSEVCARQRRAIARAGIATSVRNYFRT